MVKQQPKQYTFCKNQNIHRKVKLTNSKQLFDTIQSKLLKVPINKQEIAIAYIADTPGNSTLLTCGRCLVCLALDAEIHYVIPANGTIVHHNVCQHDTHNHIQQRTLKPNRDIDSGTTV